MTSTSRLRDPAPGANSKRRRVGLLISVLACAWVGLLLTVWFAGEPPANPAPPGSEDAGEVAAAPAISETVEPAVVEPAPGASPTAESSADAPVAAASWFAPELGEFFHPDAGPRVMFSGAPTETVQEIRLALTNIMTGQAVRDAAVRFTVYHGDGSFENACRPPIHSETLEPDAAGLALPAVFPEDPRLLAQVEIVRPGFHPTVIVLAGRRGPDGFWSEALTPDDEPVSVVLSKPPPGREEPQELAVQMRPVLTIPLEILAPDGRALPGLPIRVTPRRDRHSLADVDDVEVALNGRLVTKGVARVLHTDASGALHLPFHDHAYELECLVPRFSLFHHNPRTEKDELGRVNVVLPFQGVVQIHAVNNWLEEHVLVDEDDAPIAAAEVEIVLEGMTPLRVFTNENGAFPVGVMLFPRDDPAVGFRNPRRGRLTVLSPRFHDRGVDVSFPDRRLEVALPARPALLLTFRCVTGESAEATPVSTDGLAVSLDMTPMRFGADGQAVFSGALPAPGTTFEVFVNGFLPRELVAPESTRGQLVMNLGDVLFIRGETRTLLVSGVVPAALRNAVLFMSPSWNRTQVQRYPVRDDGRVSAHGLRPGTYVVSVEGPFLDSHSGTVEVHEEAEEKPIEVLAYQSREEEAIVSGKVRDLDPFDAVRAQVIERYFLTGVDEPVTLPAYALSPDGSFGSVRKMRRLDGVYVTLVSATELASESHADREPPAPGNPSRAVFDLGDVWLRRQHHAEVTFVAPGLGRVAPPLRVTLEGEAGVETIARWRLHRRKLVADNLRPGQYRIEWLDRDGAAQTEGFEIRAGQGLKAEVSVTRSALAEELIEVRVVGSDQQPLDEARVSPPAPLTHPALEPDEPGVVLVPIRPAAPNRFKVDHPGFLSARVEVDAGGAIPREVVLYRPASARARMLDTDGLPITGDVEIDWEPLTPTAISHGAPLRVRVDNGRLKASRLPPLPLVFKLRLAASEVALERRFTLIETEDEQDLGTLRLSETRLLRGVVIGLDGEPVDGAVVALLPRARAFRFPLEKPLDLSRHRFKTRTDVQGQFRLEGLPLDIADDLLLVALLDGFGNAVEDPVDWSASSHELRLEAPTTLRLDVGYRSGTPRDEYRFALEFRADPADPEARVDLGEVLPDFYGLHRYSGIQPGYYRVRWELRNAYTPIPPLWEDIFLPAGSDGYLRLKIDDRKAIAGVATLNGEPLERGWILLTHDPGVNGGTRVGRVIDGHFLLVDPPEAFRGYAAVVPEGSPQALQNIARGEALPEPVDDYRAAWRDGRLDFDYKAFDVTLRFAPEFLARHPGAVLLYDRYEWDKNRFRTVVDQEPIEAPVVRFRLMKPGRHMFTVRSARGTLVSRRSVVIRDKDVELLVR